MRDLDYVNQWVLIIIPVQVKPILERLPGSHIAGFVYIDRQAGMSMFAAVVCNRIASGGLVRVGNPADINASLRLRYPVWKSPDIEVLAPEQRLALNLPEVPDWLSNYDDGSMDEIRAMRFLDELRAPGFPDDVKIPLYLPGLQIEEVWGRILRHVPEGDFDLTLLNQPHQDFGVNAGDTVRMQIRQLPDMRLWMSFQGKSG
jgi:hypothetical protein